MVASSLRSSSLSGGSREGPRSGTEAKRPARAPLLIVGAIIASALGSASPALRPALAASQPPIGFERWTVPEANSGVDFALTAKQVFQQYAQPMVAPGLTPTDGTKDKRLIDIEVRADSPGFANYVYDVVWVTVEGHFDLESGFVPKLSEAELHMLPHIQHDEAACMHRSFLSWHR